MRRRSKRREMDTSLTVMTIMGIFAGIFIVTMIVTFWVKGAVPDTLIQYVLGAGGVEAFLLAGIKISKVLTEAKTPKKAVRSADEEPEEDNPEEGFER